MKKNLSVLFVAAECAPFFKVGGLADVIGSLPYALQQRGIDVAVLLPKYGVLDAQPHTLRTTSHQFSVDAEGTTYTVGVWRSELPQSSIPVYFLEQDTFFAQGNVYLQQLTAPSSERKRMRRFAFFARAVAQAIMHLDVQPDVVHFHDWHTGLLPTELQLLVPTHNVYAKIKSVLTIHNIGYQGRYPMRDVAKFFGWNRREQRTIAAYALKRGELNFLNLAVRASDAVTTVSPTHAREIRTRSYGYDLERTLRKKGVTGILNGIDVDVFNPQKDAALVRRYSVAGFVKGKRANKKALQRELGLSENPQVPLIAVIGRLAYQKGIELLIANSQWLVEQGAQVAVLGSGLPDYEQSLCKLAAAYPRHIFARIGFNAKLAQQLYAGSDILVMPSRYEPCGLGQMIAMRYGTVPVARSTGGLADTVVSHPHHSANGFLFTAPTAAGLRHALSQALEVYTRQPKTWKKIVRNGMRGDYSWNTSAKEYVKLYHTVVRGRE